MNIFQCSTCEQLHISINENNKRLSCCNKEMDLLGVNNSNDNYAKHRPIVRTIGNFVKVTIGDDLHASTDIHHISLVILETNKGVQYKYLNANDKQVVDFLIMDGEEVLKIYTYCNVHGLFSSE